MTRHIRGRPKPPMWYPNWPLYVCDSRYNDRDRVFVRIKNWNSCIPDELRKADFMPIMMYDRTVMPRKVDSPFLKGIKGPGGLVEEDEGRRKSKRAAAAKSGGTPAASSLAAAITSGEGGPGPQTGHVPIPGPSAALSAKGPTDRSLTVAAGGRPALGGDPVIETLPEETGMCGVPSTPLSAVDFAILQSSTSIGILGRGNCCGSPVHRFSPSILSPSALNIAWRTSRSWRGRKLLLRRSGESKRRERNKERSKPRKRRMHAGSA